MNKYVLILIVLYSVLLLAVNLVAVAGMLHKSYGEIQVIYRNLWIITLVLLFLLLSTALIVKEKIRG